ncbi:MAG: hypothetical protein QM831_02880 [Kofleriaceae bacterium]
MRWALLVFLACTNPAMKLPVPLATHSSSIALAGDRLYVVDPDADAVSIIDPATRTLVDEISLGHPDTSGGRFTPSVMPRALAVDADTLYVTGQRAGRLFAIDLATHAIRTVAVGSEPIGVLIADGSVYVACSQDDTVVRVNPQTLAIEQRYPVAPEPWALAYANHHVMVTHLVRPEISVIGGKPWSIPTIRKRENDARLPHGEPRGFYDLVARPQTDELWVAHILLGTDTSQPALDFETTVFPAVSLIRSDGAYRRTLSVDAEDIPRTDGSFGDVVSGPHAIAFTSDGAYAFVVDTNSEDVLVVDARTEVEASLLRPLPGHMPEGIAIAPDDRTIYVDERNSHDVAVLAFDRGALTVTATIERLHADPMPADLRLGQHLFFSANSDETPITRNHWVACASCHIEGRSDAVTWQFTQGPRDTPSNAGGTDGFLFRTGDRTRVQDYWQTIDIEQGGRFDATAQKALLDPLAAFVERGIPAPIPPTTNPDLVTHGARVFLDAGCASCHSGPRFTDSGAGNPTLDLAGPVVLHDVGTCAESDVIHPDFVGHPREACAFDTPTLVGIASTPPYFHDGSAATLLDVVARHAKVAREDAPALVEYLRSL